MSQRGSGAGIAKGHLRQWAMSLCHREPCGTARLSHKGTERQWGNRTIGRRILKQRNNDAEVGQRRYRTASIDTVRQWDVERWKSDDTAGQWGNRDNEAVRHWKSEAMGQWSNKTVEQWDSCAPGQRGRDMGALREQVTEQLHSEAVEQ